MLCQQDFIKTVECRIGSRYLCDDIRAVTVFFYHAFDAADLSFNAAQAIDHIFPFLLGTLFFLTAFTSMFFFHSDYVSSLSDTLYGYPSASHYIPPAGIMQELFFSIKMSVFRFLENTHVLFIIPLWIQKEILL